MSFEGLQPVADPSVGDWIAPRLHGFGSRVHCVVPDGFAGYVRVLHPAGDAQNREIRWSEVCRQTGRTAHALMRWDRIAVGWNGSPPREGHAPPSVLEPLLGVLAGFTAPGAACFSALWEGWGWLHRGAWAFLAASDGAEVPGTTVPPPPGLPAEVTALPRLSLPGRAYLIFRGPLQATLRMGHQVTDDWFLPQSPSLLWPEDRSWCVATEIDFDSTLVGGPAELVHALLEEPRLEAWPVEPADDFTDVVNG